MKVPTIFVFILHLSVSNAAMKTRFRALKCSSLNESLASMTCFLKAYSRNYVTINYVETRKVVYSKPIELKFKMKFRYGTIYQEVFHSEFEWCSLVGGTTNNVVANLFVFLIKKSSPELLETCPVPIGVREVNNLTVDDSTWPSPITSGFYRMEVVFGKFWTIQVDTEIISEVKTNLG